MATEAALAILAPALCGDTGGRPLDGTVALVSGGGGEQGRDGTPPLGGSADPHGEAYPILGAKRVSGAVSCDQAALVSPL